MDHWLNDYTSTKIMKRCGRIFGAYSFDNIGIGYLDRIILYPEVSNNCIQLIM
jgi:hypothetical protein